APIERLFVSSEPLGTRRRRPGERVEIEAGEPPAGRLRRAVAQQGAGAGPVAVGEMLKPDGDLDQPLEREAIASLRGHPARFQEFVHLEVEPRVEEPGGGAERRRERGARRIERAPSQGCAGSSGPLGELSGLLPEAAGERDSTAALLEELAGSARGK